MMIETRERREYIPVNTNANPESPIISYQRGRVLRVELVQIFIEKRCNLLYMSKVPNPTPIDILW